MKCVDCLPLLEEFFDGEVEEKTGATMRMHLASCAECAEAFDALRLEQEVFLRYDREVEVTPALWHGVRSRIASVSIENSRQPLIKRLSGSLAATFAFLSMRPAFSSALAVAVVGVTAGVIWFERSPSVIDSNLSVVNVEAPTVIDRTTFPAPPPPSPADRPIEAGTSKGRQGRDTGSSRVDNSTLARAAITPSAREATVVDIIHHDVPDDLPDIAGSTFDDVADAMAMLNPEDEAVARHVEKAQSLLRSFKNTRPSEGTGDIAYERELSRKLLEENVSLRLEAETNGNKTAKRVLSSLEPFLVDISNLREQPSRGDVRSIKDRMEKQEIIASLHVYD